MHKKIHIFWRTNRLKIFSIYIIKQVARGPGSYKKVGLCFCRRRLRRSSRRLSNSVSIVVGDGGSGGVVGGGVVAGGDGGGCGGGILKEEEEGEFRYRWQSS